MKKIYEADNENIIWSIRRDNDSGAFDRNHFSYNDIGIIDLVMIGKTKEFPIDSCVGTKWSLNGLLPDIDGDFIIIEPLGEQINNGKALKINEVNTIFDGKIKLSDKAIILMPEKKYDELVKNPELKKAMDNMNIRLYNGHEDYALEMLFYDKSYTYLPISREGYIHDKKSRIDLVGYSTTLSQRIREIDEKIQNKERIKIFDYKKNIKGYKKNTDGLNYVMITGLTEKVEGEANLGEEMYGATDIGKRKETQEDAILLIKDKENPKFRMLAIADGVGGRGFRGSCK